MRKRGRRDRPRHQARAWRKRPWHWLSLLPPNEQGSSCFGPLKKLATAPGAGSGGEAPRRHGIVHSVTLFFSYRNGDLSGKTSNYCLLLTKVTEWGTRFKEMHTSVQFDSSPRSLDYPQSLLHSPPSCPSLLPDPGSVEEHPGALQDPDMTVRTRVSPAAGQLHVKWFLRLCPPFGTSILGTACCPKEVDRDVRCSAPAGSYLAGAPRLRTGAKTAGRPTW